MASDYRTNDGNLLGDDRKYFVVERRFQIIRRRILFILIEEMRVLFNLVLWSPPCRGNSLSLVLLFVERIDILFKSYAIKI